MKKIWLVFFLLCFTFSAWAQPTGQIHTISANPKAGFAWDYLLYIPDSLDKLKTLPILFTMNDSGIFDSAEELEAATRARFGRGNEDYIAYELGVPLVLPLVARERGPVNSHDLNRAAFLLPDGPFKRLDKQAIAMLKDARKQLKKMGIKSRKKFLVAGFSSAGAFGWKLALLQPKHILAVAAGGEVYPALPVEKWQGEELIFPVGVSDLKEVTGQAFNRKAWLKVPILLTNGEYDYNDPLFAVFGAEDGALLKRVFGNGTVQDRWERARVLMAQLAPNVQTHTYPKIEHEPMQRDMISFLRTHLSGGPLQPIVLTDTSANPVRLPLEVKGLYWGEETPLTQDREYLKDTDLMLQVSGDYLPSWIRAVTVDVLQEQEPILKELKIKGFFTQKDSFFLQVPISEEEVDILKNYTQPVFSIKANLAQVLSVPEELTFTVK